MSTENNKVLIRRVTEESWNQGNLALLDELVSSDFVLHDPNYPQPVRGAEGFKQYVQTFRSAFPDLHFTIEDIIGEGDALAVRQTGRGTHQGELFGIPATGKQVTVTAMIFHRFASGKPVENWVNSDSMGMLQQLGVIPAMS
jgi:steroid delta-isomerase-like uncharacterized protein